MYETFQCSGNKVVAKQAYKIKDNCGEEGVIYINRNCPHSSKTTGACASCHGCVCQVSKKGKKVMKEVYTDRFTDNDGYYYDIMEASNYMEEMEILEVLQAKYNPEQGVNESLHAGMWPATFKTDCLNCKARYSSKKELTPCQKAREYSEKNGVLISIATEKQLLDLKLPSDCICKEQRQRVVGV